MRAAACYAIGMLLGGQKPASQEHQQHQQHPQQHSPHSAHLLPLDIVSARTLVGACDDGSPIVRHEATVALGSVVGKYLNMFATVANQMMSKGREGAGGDAVPSGETPDAPWAPMMEDEEGETGRTPTAGRSASGAPSSAVDSAGLGLESTINEETAEDFAFIWTALRGIQHTDPHPSVSSAALAIVQTVHERVLYLQSMRAEVRQRERDREKEATSSPGQHDDGAGDQDARATTGRKALPHANSMASMGGAAPTATLRRGVSAGPGGGGGVASSGLPFSPSAAAATAHGAPATFETPMYQTYQLPVSGFYEWKRKEFSYGKEADALELAGTAAAGGANSGSGSGAGGVSSGGGSGSGSGGNNGGSTIHSNLPSTNYAAAAAAVAGKPLDPMSLEGSMKAYRKRRDDKAHETADALARKYAHLIPKPKGGLNSSTNDDDFYGGDDGERRGGGGEGGGGGGGNKAEKKAPVKMDQSAVLDNDSDMTSNILFHPYENYLVVCDDFDGVSVWNFDDGKKELNFSNANKHGSRMTSVSWLNDSILAVGCCDGTVRLWDNVIHSSSRGEAGDVAAPASAFFAAPDMTAGQRGSGLVMEWAEKKNALICGGNSSMVRVWDMQKEQAVSSFPTGSDVCLTCLTQACDKDEQGAFVNSSQGPFGPDVVVAGFGDGALRVYDLRAPQKPVISYLEHGSWIVNTAFTTFGGRPELLSGCISGECKFWDLRLPASLRNLDVQRSPMTAFAVHNRVPLIASGAHAQYLKILDFEGETKNVIRYHEGFLGQRIGAVSCLAFHPHKLLLAAGATDPFISLYSQ